MQNTKKQSQLPRQYYRLNQAAVIIGCTEDDLIHLAAQQEITLCINLYGQLDDIEIIREPSHDIPLSNQPTPFGMFEIPWDYMRVFEVKGSIKATDFNNMDENGDYWAVNLSSPVNLTLNQIFVPAWEIDNLQLLQETEKLSTYLEETHSTSAKKNILQTRVTNDGFIDEPQRQTIERDNLMKMLGGMALLIAEKHGKYRRGEKPNASAIAEAMAEIIEQLPSTNTYGLSPRNIRDKLPEAIRLLTDA